MRISTYSQTLTDQMYLSRLQEKMGTQQVQLATGKMFAQISDDPIRANQAMLINQAQNRLDQYQKNIDDTSSALSQMESSMAGAVDLYQQVRETGLLASSDTYNATDRATFAKTVDASLQTLLGIANSQNLGRYVFAGQALQTQPFVYNGTAVTYQGNNQQMVTNVAPSLQTPTTWDGSAVFQDAFQSIISLRDAMNTGTSTDVQNAVKQLDTAFQKVIDARSEVGVYMKNADDLKNMYDTEKTALEEKKSNAQDVDVPQTMMEYMRTQNMQQALAMAMNKAMNNSLVDIFR